MYPLCIPEKYELVGRLLKPGEEPTNYSDEEAEETDASSGAPGDEDRKTKWSAAAARTRTHVYTDVYERSEVGSQMLFYVLFGVIETSFYG